MALCGWCCGSVVRIVWIGVVACQVSAIVLSLVCAAAPGWVYSLPSEIQSTVSQDSSHYALKIGKATKELCSEGSPDLFRQYYGAWKYDKYPCNSNGRRYVSQDEDETMNVSCPFPTDGCDETESTNEIVDSFDESVNQFIAMGGKKGPGFDALHSSLVRLRQGLRGGFGIHLVNVFVLVYAWIVTAVVSIKASRFLMTSKIKIFSFLLVPIGIMLLLIMVHLIWLWFACPAGNMDNVLSFASDIPPGSGNVLYFQIDLDMAGMWQFGYCTALAVTVMSLMVVLTAAMIFIINKSLAQQTISFGTLHSEQHEHDYESDAL
eukprot:ANDGO_03041.mRNA.1 hypothetical protein